MYKFLGFLQSHRLCHTRLSPLYLTRLLRLWSPSSTSKPLFKFTLPFSDFRHPSSLTQQYLNNLKNFLKTPTTYVLLDPLDPHLILGSTPVSSLSRYIRHYYLRNPFLAHFPELISTLNLLFFYTKNTKPELVDFFCFTLSL